MASFSRSVLSRSSGQRGVDRGSGSARDTPMSRRNRLRRCGIYGLKDINDPRVREMIDEMLAEKGAFNEKGPASRMTPGH